PCVFFLRISSSIANLRSASAISSCTCAGGSVDRSSAAAMVYQSSLLKRSTAVRTCNLDHRSMGYASSGRLRRAAARRCAAARRPKCIRVADVMSRTACATMAAARAAYGSPVDFPLVVAKTTVMTLPPLVRPASTPLPRHARRGHGLFEHPNVLMVHPQPGVRPVSHAGTLDPHPLNELQPLPLQLLSVPLRHPHNLASPNVVFDVDDKHTAASEHPDALGPNAPVRLPVRLAPLHLARIGRMERSSEGVAVRVSPRPVTGVVMVGHAVPVCGTRHDGIKLTVTCPRHSRRVSDVHLDMCRSLCGPLRFDLVGDDATREA